MTLAAPTESPLHLHITAGAESRVRAGHPWVYAESIRAQDRLGKLGELAVVYDRKDRFLALGLFDPHSPLRVRIVQFGRAEKIDRPWWSGHLEKAIRKRRALFDAETTGYRWINGESDGWPGLVLDRYAQTLVLKLYTAAWLSRLDEIVGLVENQLRPERILLRLSRNIARVAKQEFHNVDAQLLVGPPLTRPVIFHETGLRFEADVLRGQKTGFFLDQRDNRRRVEALALGRTVLNAFSFSGGFSLYAARGGASSVIDLDISGHALSSGDRNFALNSSMPEIARCRRETIRADAFNWLLENKDRQFDLIVLDPPSMARRQSERIGAIRAYARLVRFALPHLARGGILVACSCSAHVSAEEFFCAVRNAFTSSRRRFAEIQTARNAPDHPATFAEAEYLKAIYCEVN